MEAVDDSGWRGRRAAVVDDDVVAVVRRRRRRHHVFQKVGDGFPFLRRESPICGCVPKWWLTPKSTKTIAMQFIL